MTSRVRIVLLALLPAVLACPKRFDPRHPSTSAEPPPALPEAAVSAIGVPISIDLGPALQAADQTLPPAYGSNDWDGDDRPVDAGYDYWGGSDGKLYRARYRIVRGPLTATVSGSTVTASVPVSYHIDLQIFGGIKYPIGKYAGGHCVNGGMRLTATVELHVLPTWRLQSTTRVDAEPTAPCVFDTGLPLVPKADVTNRVTAKVKEFLGNYASQLDARLSAVDVRTPAQEAWRLLEGPIPLGGGAWLVPHPAVVRASANALRAESTVLSIDAGFDARSEVVVAESAPVVSSTTLPDLAVSSPGSSFFIQADGRISYAYASQRAREALLDKRFPSDGRLHVVVKDVRIFSLGGGLACVQLELTGDAKGTLFLYGHPRFDPLQNELSFPDLDFTKETNDSLTRPGNWLVKGADWLAHDKLRDFVRKNAVVSTRQALEQLRSAIADAVSARKLAQNVFLNGTVSSVEGLGVVATDKDIVVRVQTTGTARVDGTAGPVVLPASFWR